MPWRSRKASSAWVITSTMALPMQTTSSGLGRPRRAAARSSASDAYAGSVPEREPSPTEPRSLARIARRRRPVPSCPARWWRRHRYDARPLPAPRPWCRPLRPSLEPTSSATFAGTSAPPSSREATDASCSTRSSSRSTRRGSPTADGDAPRRRRDRPRRRAPSGLTSTLDRRPPAGHWTAAHRVPRGPQRQAARLLPVDLHRRPTAPSRSSPPPSSRPPTPAGPSRAGTSPTSRPSSPSPSWSTTTSPPSPTPPRSTAPPRGRRQRRGPLRRHHGDVDLPGGLRRRPARGHRAGRRRRHRRCGSSTRRARATSPPSRSRSAPSASRYFADYYGIAYPGDKLDLVAVPDFAFGAMENLGCVTFREVLLLVDPAHGHPARAAATSPTSSPTRSPTCGSATS